MTRHGSDLDREVSDGVKILLEILLFLCLAACALIQVQLGRRGRRIARGRAQARGDTPSSAQIHSAKRIHVALIVSMGALLVASRLITQWWSYLFLGAAACLGFGYAYLVRQGRVSPP
jgi:hypothetical protein